MSSSDRIVVLGGSPEGWHAEQLQQAARRLQVEILFLPYESLSASEPSRLSVRSILQGVEFEWKNTDVCLTRTMPSASLEKVTFRLACLHTLLRRGVRVVNPPSGLELAIDKYASTCVASEFGIPTPRTEVVQDRSAAMHAFDALGGDVVVKPVFGGEGRGVMRIQNRDLAWTVFGSLEAIDATIYLQSFLAPGGVDRRVFLIDQQAWVVRRENTNDFRTNRQTGSKVFSVDKADEEATKIIEWARQIQQAMGLSIAAVDFIDDDLGNPHFLEINAIPGWKQMQSVTKESLAEAMLHACLDSGENIAYPNDHSNLASKSISFASAGSAGGVKR